MPRRSPRCRRAVVRRCCGRSGDLAGVDEGDVSARHRSPSGDRQHGCTSEVRCRRVEDALARDRVLARDDIGAIAEVREVEGAIAGEGTRAQCLSVVASHADHDRSGSGGQRHSFADDRAADRSGGHGEHEVDDRSVVARGQRAEFHTVGAWHVDAQSVVARIQVPDGEGPVGRGGGRPGRSAADGARSEGAALDADPTILHDSDESAGWIDHVDVLDDGARVDDRQFGRLVEGSSVPMTRAGSWRGEGDRVGAGGELEEVGAVLGDSRRVHVARGRAVRHHGDVADGRPALLGRGAGDRAGVGKDHVDVRNGRLCSR